MSTLAVKTKQAALGAVGELLAGIKNLGLISSVSIKLEVNIVGSSNSDPDVFFEIHDSG